MSIIVILGPDGTGKTTVADMLVKKFKKNKISARHYPQRFGILPRLFFFKKIFLMIFRKNGFPKKNNSYKEIFDLSQNHPLLSLVYISWYGVDYFLGGIIIKLKNFFSKRIYVAVFARYFYDYYYQSNNRRLPVFVKKIIGIIVPEPSFIFFINRDAKSIFEDKPELPIEEIKFQQNYIIEFLGSKKNFKIIDGELGPVDTVNNIFEIITNSRKI